MMPSRILASGVIRCARTWNRPPAAAALRRTRRLKVSTIDDSTKTLTERKAIGGPVVGRCGAVVGAGAAKR
jgi:hypothetical protein